ncbi:hypothetical protein P9209_04105 [Prescottella defluvii]|nr:hypothetical protein P9209_04105 [Prescottella defluvii]
MNASIGKIRPAAMAAYAVRRMIFHRLDLVFFGGFGGSPPDPPPGLREVGGGPAGGRPPGPRPPPCAGRAPPEAGFPCGDDRPAADDHPDPAADGHHPAAGDPLSLRRTPALTRHGSGAAGRRRAGVAARSRATHGTAGLLPGRSSTLLGPAGPAWSCGRPPCGLLGNSRTNLQ